MAKTTTMWRQGNNDTLPFTAQVSTESQFNSSNFSDRDREEAWTATDFRPNFLGIFRQNMRFLYSDDYEATWSWSLRSHQARSVYMDKKNRRKWQCKKTPPKNQRLINQRNGQDGCPVGPGRQCQEIHFIDDAIWSSSLAIREFGHFLRSSLQKEETRAELVKPNEQTQ